MAVSTIDPNGLNIGQIGGTRNKIINGAMVIDQRNAGAAVTANNAFPVDRFITGFSFDGTVTVQRSTVAPVGFTNSIGFTVTSPDSSIGATQFYVFRQRIEGFNIADLGWGSSGAKTVTLSFWVRSSITGTYGATISNAADSRLYPTSYTINSADTWEQKTIVVLGDTTGTWATDNSTGLQVQFHLALGSSYQGTTNAWNASSIYGPSGMVNWTGTSGATFYITGVQLEVGDTATPFEHRSYGQELALCKRYYQRLRQGLAGRVESSTGIGGAMAFPVEMRASPTQSLLNGTSAWWVPGIGQYTITGTLDYNSSPIGFHIAAQVSGSPTTGNMAFLTLRTNDIYAFSAEL